MPKQEPASAWIFENTSVRVGTQGLFRPYLKTFVPPFLPSRLTAPESPRVVYRQVPFFFSRKRIWVTGIVLFLFCPVTNIAPRRTFLYQMIFLVTFVVKLLFSFSKGSAISAAIADHIRLTCLMFLTFVVATITYIATKSVFYNLKRDGFYHFFCPLSRINVSFLSLVIDSAFIIYFFVFLQFLQRLSLLHHIKMLLREIIWTCSVMQLAIHNQTSRGQKKEKVVFCLRRRLSHWQTWAAKIMEQCTSVKLTIALDLTKPTLPFPCCVSIHWMNRLQESVRTTSNGRFILRPVPCRKRPLWGVAY